MGLGGGDRLARGAKKAQFAAGAAKVNDSVEINPSMVASEKTRKQLDKVQKETEKVVTNETPKIHSKLTPLYDRVIIRRQDEQQKIGHIFLPDESKDKPMEGLVLYVGFGRVTDEGELKPLYLKGGEHVLFGKYAGTEVKIDGELVLMMREEEVLAVIG